MLLKSLKFHKSAAVYVAAFVALTSPQAYAIQAGSSTVIDQVYRTHCDPESTYEQDAFVNGYMGDEIKDPHNVCYIKAYQAGENQRRADEANGY